MQTTALTAPTTRIWIGHWLMAVAALHTLFALLALHQPILSLVQRGLFDAVGQDPMAAATVWFVLFGALLALLALAITPLERSGDGLTLRRLGWGVLLLSVLGVVLMPVSGFWLALPAGIAMLRRRPAVART
ncbi:DUF6463 family protein [Roseateles sp.]|uniref:DUF6463 family protein n=1 Tax=Roseateles sp. TaxID=1971397 RepID=UPI00286C9B74|nr:DUF6463 family protein [Roseateles sp.]